MRLSNGEFVVNARATAQRRDVLDAINGGRVARFADGGAVGSTFNAPIIPRDRIAAPGGGATIHAPININVEGGSRGAEADADLANKIATQVHNTMRTVAVKELRSQMRPGGMLR